MIPVRRAVWFAPFLLALAACNARTPHSAEHAAETTSDTTSDDVAEDAVDAIPDNNTGDTEDERRDDANRPDILDVSRDVVTDDGADAINDETDDAETAPDLPELLTDSGTDRPCVPGCGDVEVCQDAACTNLLGVPCTTDEECGHRGICGLGGVCAKAAPIGSARFIDRSEILEDLWPAGWQFNSAARDMIGYGSAAVFHEGPDDNLTLLVAGQSDAENNLCRFTFGADGPSIDQSFCETSAANINVVTYLPAHGSLPERLAIGGIGTLTVSDINLNDPVELFTESFDITLTSCIAAVLVPIDVDLDGILDLVLSCHGTLGLTSSTAYTRVFRGLADGNFDEMPARFAAAFRRDIFLLAIGTHDFNNDGLLDHFLVVDTFSNPDRRNTTRTPGYFLRRCSPIEDCIWEQNVYADGFAAYTSHMGISQIDVDTLGSLYAISDWGPRQYLSVLTAPPTNFASLLQIGLGYDAVDEEYLYSWSHIVADFDRNGLPDLFSTQGSPEFRRVRFNYQPEHQDLVFLQEGGGRFTVVDEYGWLATAGGEPREPFRSEYSRGAIELDLDLDGLLDLYITRFGRSPMLLEEVDHGHAPRCTLRFTPRYVPTTSGGIAIATDIAGPYTTTTVQGDMRIQRPLRATVDHREGFVRFPSGAVAPYTCGESNGPIDVVEPDWLGIERNVETLTLTIAPAAWPVAITAVAVVFVDADRNRLGSATLSELLAVTDPVVASADAFMLRINDRWVHRYFVLPRE